MLDLLGCALTLTTTLVQAIDPTPAVDHADISGDRFSAYPQLTVGWVF